MHGTKGYIVEMRAVGAAIMYNLLESRMFCPILVR